MEAAKSEGGRTKAKKKRKNKKRRLEEAPDIDDSIVEELRKGQSQNNNSRKDCRGLLASSPCCSRFPHTPDETIRGIEHPHATETWRHPLLAREVSLHSSSDGCSFVPGGAAHAFNGLFSWIRTGSDRFHNVVNWQVESPVTQS